MTTDRPWKASSRKAESSDSSTQFTKLPNSPRNVCMQLLKSLLTANLQYRKTWSRHLCFEYHNYKKTKYSLSDIFVQLLSIPTTHSLDYPQDSSKSIFFNSLPPRWLHLPVETLNQKLKLEHQPVRVPAQQALTIVAPKLKTPSYAGTVKSLV